MAKGTSVKAFVFDAYDTIISGPKNEARFEAARLLGNANERHVRNIIYTLSADTPCMDYKAFLNGIIKRIMGIDAQVFDALEAMWLRYMQSLYLREEADIVLRQLRDCGFKLALVPNCTPFAALRYNELNLSNWFDEVVLSCEVGLLKPDPRIFRLATERLGVKPEETCVVGDKIKTDVLGGMLAGCQTILIDHRLSELTVSSQLPMYAVISSLKDILSLDIVLEQVPERLSTNPKSTNPKSTNLEATS